jgi:hypothetical protein
MNYIAIGIVSVKNGGTVGFIVPTGEKIGTRPSGVHGTVAPKWAQQIVP